MNTSNPAVDFIWGKAEIALAKNDNSGFCKLMRAIGIMLAENNHNGCQVAQKVRRTEETPSLTDRGNPNSAYIRATANIIASFHGTSGQWTRSDIRNGVKSTMTLTDYDLKKIGVSPRWYQKVSNLLHQWERLGLIEQADQRNLKTFRLSPVGLGMLNDARYPFDGR